MDKATILNQWEIAAPGASVLDMARGARQPELIARSIPDSCVAFNLHTPKIESREIQRRDCRALRPAPGGKQTVLRNHIGGNDYEIRSFGS